MLSEFHRGLEGGLSDTNDQMNQDMHPLQGINLSIQSIIIYQ